jgi:alkylation response protein AidB-like acyl-CoA dehydrogenase
VDFSFNEHQSIWKGKASRFTDEELRPSWRELESDRGALTAVYKKASASGLFDICSTGGKDKKCSDILTAALVTEELSKGDCGFASMFVNRYLSSRVAQMSASHDFRNEALERIANSPEGAEIAFLWPRIAASDSVMGDAAVETAGPKEADMPLGDGLSYAPSSVECFVGCGRVSPLDPLPGLHLVLVERDKVKTLEEYLGAFSPGSLRLYKLNLGEACDLKVVRQKNCDRYDKLIDNLLAERMILFSAMALGVAGAAFEYAVAYSGERVAFGRPIIQHQAIGLKLADMYIDLAAARLLLWEAACMQAEGEGEARQMDAVLDYWHRVALDIVSNVMRVLGGHGYLRDHPAEKWVREIQFLRLLR